MSKNDFFELPVGDQFQEDLDICKGCEYVDRKCKCFVCADCNRCDKFPKLNKPDRFQLKAQP